MRENLRFCYNFAPKVEHFLVNCFRKDSPLELVEKNLSGDDISVTICRAASRKICPAYGMKPKRGNRGTPGCSRYLCKIVTEAIRAELPGLGKVGYVANSTHTVVGNCCSAGRLYDKIGNTATAKVEVCAGQCRSVQSEGTAWGRTRRGRGRGHLILTFANLFL